MKYGLLVITCLLTITACSGPSKEELRRMQMLEAQRAEQAALEAQREAAAQEARVRSRKAEALSAWQRQQTIPAADINTLFSADAGQQFHPGQTYFVQFELQAAKYNYSDNKQSFTLVGMRNLPNSAVYGPLFPDDQAQYQPGQLAKSVLEFALKEETGENRLGQQILRPRGQRWVAATLNFKTYNILQSSTDAWYWEPGLFKDLSWNTTPEAAYPYTSDRALVVQMGLRFCTLRQCYLDSEYRRHPTHAVRAEVVSVLVGDKKRQQVLAEFIRAQE